MSRNIPKLLTSILLLLFNSISAQEIWSEHFLIPEKGVWGAGDGTIKSDFTGITNWSLEYGNVELKMPMIMQKQFQLQEVDLNAAILMVRLFGKVSRLIFHLLKK